MKSGVCVTAGYGVSVRTERGHLIVSQGVGSERIERRFQRAGHGLRSLVITAAAGSITSSAMEWMADVGVSWSWHKRNGHVLATGPAIAVNDARLRRSQAVHGTETLGLQLSQELIAEKIRRQCAVIEQCELGSARLVDMRNLSRIAHSALSIPEIIVAEGRAAQHYFDSWRGIVRATFTRRDSSRIPSRWLTFTNRGSGLGNRNNRNATDPINAILNFLYGISEAQTTLALLSVGLDPGLGFLHTDELSRDSLSLDLLELVRPDIDRWVIDLFASHVFTASDFHEHRNGLVTIAAPLARSLALTANRWFDLVAPAAEELAHTFAHASDKAVRTSTPLTARNRRNGATSGEATGLRLVGQPSGTTERKRKQHSNANMARICHACGVSVPRPRKYCDTCWQYERTQIARTASAVAESLANRRNAQIPIVEAERLAAPPSPLKDLGSNLNTYSALIAPHIHNIPAAHIALALGVSRRSSYEIRGGKVTPRPKRWPILLQLVELYGYGTKDSSAERAQIR